MTGAIFSMAVNVGIALLFAGSFAALALVFRAQRQALWFALAYSVGALTPLSEILVRLTPYTTLFSATSYATSLAAMLLIGHAFARFCGVATTRGIPLTIFVTGLALRAAIWGGERDSMPYELFFQLPLALACAWTVVVMTRVPRPAPLYRFVAGYFVLMSAFFIAKAFLAVAFGSGPTAKAYAGSTYALISQAGGAVMMLGVGLLILLVLVKDVTDRSRGEAETDALTGIANRRGFDRRAEQALKRAADEGQPLSIALFDLDHFKAINDAHGHDVGDEVIAAFAAILKRAAPSSALIARTGGEEFAILVEQTTAEPCRLSAEAIRLAVLTEREGGSPIISVSGGVAEFRPGETLAELVRRADQQLYRAKGAGRNLVYRAMS
ncbi:diguanylate cyclase domain-containing protein [Sphingoaurantiacus capsulatus]|uniref:diguanylate cyclase n=1 Tax=Sphingoaurantiacus capsulatus TaxID=1771310 RepID=A0ABV7XHU8_9SPHN